MIGTKGYYTNDSTHIHRSMALWDDVGYSLDIPWNSVYTAGWQFAKPSHADGVVWGYERKMIICSSLRAQFTQLLTCLCQEDDNWQVCPRLFSSKTFQ